jgi:anti-sigma B factor antagonist
MNKSEGRLSIRSQSEVGGPVVMLAGEVDLHSSPQLRQVLLEILEQRPARLIIDLSGVEYMDSSGVGTMVEIKRRLESDGGRMILAALRPRVRSVFEVTQLDRFFEIARDVREATER